MFGNNSRAQKNNTICSAFAGIVIAASWWVFVDAVVKMQQNGKGTGNWYLYLPGILGTVALFLINNLPNELFLPRSAMGFSDTEWYVKVLLVLSIILHLGGIIEAVWIYAANSSQQKNYYINFFGIAVIAQSLGIAFASFVWRFMWRDPNA